MAKREGGGKLIAISSISALFGTPLQPHYAASKGGVEALVRAYATRLARYDVQVNAVQPGWIVTDATAPAVENERFSETVVRRIPARRWGQPEDLEGIAVYLASEASRYHTGDTLRIDGGYTIF
jgi:NAD(P)-dependent dehydrogenase (short-subunit alcohol dehydrogenase family)